MAETIPLPADVPDMGRAGDFVLVDLGNPDPSLRVCVVSPRPESQLPAIREAIERAKVEDPEGLRPARGAHLSLVED